MTNARSEIAQFRHQQAVVDEAAQRGLSGLALGMARHDFIMARMEQNARRVLALVQQGRVEEANALLESDGWWTSDEQEGSRRVK